MTILSWQIEFARPIWFAALAALPLWIVFWRRSLVRMSPRRAFVAILLRGLLLVVVTAGLAGPTATGQRDMAVHVGKAGPPPVTDSCAAGRRCSPRPTHVRAGEPFSLDLLVRSETSGTATVDLLRDGQPEGQETIALAAGENHKSIAGGRAEGDVASGVFGQCIRHTPCAVRKTRGTRSVPATCRSMSIRRRGCCWWRARRCWPSICERHWRARMSRWKSGPELPDGRGCIDRYDLIILSNVPAEAVSKAQMAALQSYVRDAGGGLIAVGGDHSFTVGGYRGTPLEEILPVISESNTPKPKPTLAMVLVLDISGSMNDPVSKGAKERNIDLAKDALRTRRPHADAARPSGRAGLRGHQPLDLAAWPGCG